MNRPGRFCIFGQLIGTNILAKINYNTNHTMIIRSRKADRNGGNTNLNLSGIISDGMVLQRNAPVTIYGQTKPRQSVEVRFLGERYSTKADDDGNWHVVLSPLEAGGPYQMVISASGEEDTVINDILVGEVWLLGGQSNMQLPVRRTLDLFADEVKDVNLPVIRQYTVPERYHFHGPRDDLSGGRWISAVGDDVLQFSAAGFFFARELYKAIKVPIGLILTAIGGTPIEAWMSEPTLKQIGGYEVMLAQCKDDDYVQETIQRDQEQILKWYQHLNERDAGLIEQWYRTETAGGPGWEEVQVPARWTGTELADARGAVWYRKEFEVPESMLDRDAKLMLGTIVDGDETYLNGEKIGITEYRYPPRRYDVPRGLLKPGKNIIAVRVISTNNVGGFIPDMPYKLVAGNQEIELSGTWFRRIGVLTESMPTRTFFQYMPAGLYNGMIAPLKRYRIKGALWYQGESNAEKPEGYAQLFRAMVEDWRQLWGIGDFPFIFTQLANFEGDEPDSKDVEETTAGEMTLMETTLAKRSNWAELRDEQRRALTVPNTAMAVTIDIGEHNDLHPQDKKTLGYRLALCARKLAYGEDLVYSGPLYAGMEVDRNTVRLYFDHVGSGLVARGGGELRGFEVRSENGQYVPARAIIEGDTVVVSSEQVEQPRQVRYAWANNPAEANLYNREGLPASPFET